MRGRSVNDSTLDITGKKKNETKSRVRFLFLQMLWPSRAFDPKRLKEECDHEKRIDFFCFALWCFYFCPFTRLWRPDCVTRISEEAKREKRFSFWCSERHDIESHKEGRWAQKETNNRISFFKKIKAALLFLTTTSDDGWERSVETKSEERKFTVSRLVCCRKMTGKKQNDFIKH